MPEWYLKVDTLAVNFRNECRFVCPSNCTNFTNTGLISIFSALEQISLVYCPVKMRRLGNSTSHLSKAAHLQLLPPPDLPMRSVRPLHKAALYKKV